MPRRRKTTRPTRLLSTSFTYEGRYAAGAGQINITPKQLGLDLGRPYRPLRASVEVCLTGNAGIIAAEPVLIKAYNWAIDSDVVSIVGPRIVGVLPRRFNIRWPYTAPTQIGTDARKLLSIYDFGTDSKLGMQIIVRIWVHEGPNIPGMAYANDLPDKQVEQSSTYRN